MSQSALDNALVVWTSSSTLAPTNGGQMVVVSSARQEPRRHQKACLVHFFQRCLNIQSGTFTAIPKTEDEHKHTRTHAHNRQNPLDSNDKGNEAHFTQLPRFECPPCSFSTLLEIDSFARRRRRPTTHISCLCINPTRRYN